MNDLDREIRRAFAELVEAAPPPPLGPGRLPQRTSRDGRSGRRVLALACCLLLGVAGVALVVQRDTADDTLVTLDEPLPSLGERPAASIESTVPTSTVEPVVADEYQLVAGLPMPGTTEPIPAPGEPYSGVYFAYLHEGPPAEDPQRLRFDVFQAFSGEDCATRFGDESPSVCSPIGLDIAGPTDRVEIAVTGVPVTVRDITGGASYGISGAELIALVSGASPDPSAPDGFLFSGGVGFLLTYDAGALIRIDQPADPATE